MSEMHPTAHTNEEPLKKENKAAMKAAKKAEKKRKKVPDFAQNRKKSKKNLK